MEDNSLACTHGTEQRQDQELLTRFNSLPNGDLVAAEARYHRGKKLCFPKYTHFTIQNQSADKNTFKVALNQIIVEYNDSIINEKEVYLLTTPREWFHTILHDAGVVNAETYTSHYLKKNS